MKNIFTILLLFPILAPCQSLLGEYRYNLTFDNSSLYRIYDMELKSDSTFKMSKYVYESCYVYSDTLKGQWTINNDILSFYNISQSKYVSNSKSLDVDSTQIIVQENCMFSYMRLDSSGIKLLVLDSSFVSIGVLNPENYNYDRKEEVLLTKFTIPTEAFQIIYLNGFTVPFDHYSYGGINLTDFKINNRFEISNCGMGTDLPPQFISPYIQYKNNKNGSLRSVKKYIEIDGKERFRIFEKRL